MVVSSCPQTEVQFQDVSQAPSFAGCPGFKTVILSIDRTVGPLLLASGEFGSGPSLQGSKNPRVCSPFLHASLHSPREACRNLPCHFSVLFSPGLSWLSPSLGGCSALCVSLPSWLELGECSSQSGSQAARASFISLLKYIWALLGASTSLSFSAMTWSSSSASSDQPGIMQCRAAQNNLVGIQGCIFTERLRECVSI